MFAGILSPLDFRNSEIEKKTTMKHNFFRLSISRAYNGLTNDHVSIILAVMRPCVQHTREETKKCSLSYATLVRHMNETPSALTIHVKQNNIRK